MRRAQGVKDLSSSAPPIVRLALVAALGGAALACVPQTPSYDAGAEGPRTAPLDFLPFVHDRPAVGGDWYDYNEEGGHLITPAPHVYVVREGTGASARYAAFRVLSYYDPDTADSGRFTLAYRLYDDGWLVEQEWLTPKNVKDDGALCLDLFSQSERDCGSTSWQLMLRATRWLALEGPIVVARPTLAFKSAFGVAAAGDVSVLTLSERSSLDGLPAPTSLPDLVDGPQLSWTSAEWDRASYALEVPERGMAVGARLLGEDASARADVWMLLNARRSLVRFTAALLTEGDLESGLRFTFSRVSVDIVDDTVPLEAPPPTTATVAMPQPGQRALLTFEREGGDLIVPHDGAFHDPPPESTWDLALQRLDDGGLRVLLSPGAAVYNATQRDGTATLEEALPPERSSP